MNICKDLLYQVRYITSLLSMRCKHYKIYLGENVILNNVRSILVISKHCDY